MGRVQLKHMLIDVNFPNHNKIRMLGKQFGVAGKWALIEIYAAMSKATNAVIEGDFILLIAEESCVANPEEFFTYCLEKGLFQKELDGYSNTPVIEDQEALYKQQEKWRNKKRLPGDSPEKPKGGSSECAELSEHLNTEQLNNNKNKNGHAPESGLERLSEHVRISPINKELFENRIKLEGLDEKAKQEIIEALDRDFHKNPEKQGEKCHYKDLISWPLREIRKDRADLSRKNPFKPPEKSIKEIREEAVLARQIKELERQKSG